MAVLGQTSPDRAEQIYLDTQHCRPLGASRRAPVADTSHLPRNTRWHQTDCSAWPVTGRGPALHTLGSRWLSRDQGCAELIPIARVKSIQADPPDRHISLPVRGVGG